MDGKFWSFQSNCCYTLFKLFTIIKTHWLSRKLYLDFLTVYHYWIFLMVYSVRLGGCLVLLLYLWSWCSYGCMYSFIYVSAKRIRIDVCIPYTLHNTHTVCTYTLKYSTSWDMHTVHTGEVIFIFLIGQKTALNQRSCMILEIQIQIFGTHRRPRVKVFIF